MKRSWRIGFGFGERQRSKNQVRMLSIKSGFDVRNKPALEPSKRPALIVCARAHHRRCAREGLNGGYDGVCTAQLASSTIPAFVNYIETDLHAPRRFTVC